MAELFHDGLDPPFDSLNAEVDAIRRSVQVSGKLQSPNARRHLQQGLGTRLFMLRHSYHGIWKIMPPTRKTPLRGDDYHEANVYLNSMYLHLVGGLDNLAWAFHYEHGLLGDHDETHGRTRVRCNLFGEDFLAALGDHRSDLMGWLRNYSDWDVRLRKARNPAAHRIPLTWIPAVHSKEEARETQQAQEAFNEAMSRGDLDQAEATMTQLEAGGTHVPWAIVHNASDFSVRSLNEEIAKDYRTFLEVVHRVLTEIVAAPPS